MKNKPFVFLLAVLVTVLFSSCQKQGPTTVEGRVVDKNNTLKGVSGAIVYLYEANGDTPDGGIFGGGSVGKLLKQTTSASDGTYGFGFDAQKKHYYTVSAEHPECETCASDYCYVSVDKPGRKNKGVNIPLYTYGYARVHIKNIHPFDQFDYFNMNNYSFKRPLYGISIDTTIKIKLISSITNNISCFVTKNNIQNTFIISIYCPPFDTTDFSINY